MRRRLPDTRTGKTLHFVVTTSEGEVDGYVQTGEYENGALGEVFLRIGHVGDENAIYDQWAVAFSIALQNGAEVGGLCDKFARTKFAPAGQTNVPGIPFCMSILDLVCRWLKLRYVAEKCLTQQARCASNRAIINHRGDHIMNLEKQLQKIVTNFSSEIAGLVEAHVASLKADAVKLGSRRVMLKVTKKSVKTGPMSAAKMRCRHEYRGKRCEARSRGPRFRYLCAKHCAK